MKNRGFSYRQAIVALGLIALGSFLLMTGTALIAMVVATVMLMLLFAHFLFGRKAVDQGGKHDRPKDRRNAS